MASKTGSWAWTSTASLHEAVDKLLGTRGVRSIKILPGQVEYEHLASVSPDLLPKPEELKVTWENVLGEAELLRYACRSIVEGIIWGAIELRKRQRVATHLLVWSRKQFYASTFGDSWWAHDREFNDELWGMSVVDMQNLLGEGKVVVCGGSKHLGEPEDIDLGLILEVGGG